MPFLVGALGCGESGGGVEMSEGPDVRFERFDPLKRGAHNGDGGRAPAAHAFDEGKRRFLKDRIRHWLAACDEGDQASNRVNIRPIVQ